MPVLFIRLKLPPRFAGAAFAFYMSAIVALIMTIALTVVNVGLSQDLPAKVIQGYVIAWPIAFGSVLLVRPVVIKLVSWTVALPEGKVHGRT